ncbi:oligosaccharide flippase family protein [Rhodococcus sp. A14]|uniref:oligosaccharide flippase family protein n=1 Tax=Rhodococcus sp. A14 TaxID=1194106 RepID=UPI00142211DA|nr:oligosaccharide flippase family protein [Rhodococcus sp. A14]
MSAVREVMDKASVPHRMTSVMRNEKVRSMGAYALGPILGILSGPILARALGPDGRGQFASVMEPITVAGAVAGLGIPAAVAYFIARGADGKLVYRLGSLLGTVPALATYAFMIWYAGIVSAEQRISFWFLVAAWSVIVVSSLVQLRRGYWQGRANWLVLDKERAYFGITRFLSVFVLAAIGISTAQFFVAASLLSFAACASILFWSGGRFRIGYHPDRPAFVRYSVMSSVGTITAVATSRLDQILMPVTSTSEQLGFYAVAVTVAEVPLVLAALASRNAFQYAACGRTNRQIFIEVRIFFFVCFLLVVALELLAPLVVPLVFGLPFAASVQSIQFLGFGTLATWASLVCGAIIGGRGYPALSSLISAVSLVITTIFFVVNWSSVSSLLAAQISLGSSLVAACIGFAILLVKRAPVSSVESRVLADGA